MAETLFGIWGIFAAFSSGRWLHEYQKSVIMKKYTKLVGFKADLKAVGNGRSDGTMNLMK